jgi:hypothetical protein
MSLVVLVATLAIGIVARPAAGQDAPNVPDPPDPAEVERRALVVIDEDGNALDGGGSSTLFGVALEGDDECPGDSQNDQYRIDSYMVPLDVDPSQLTYTQLGPSPPAFRDYAGFQMPLYKLNKDPFAAELTARAQEPGGPGPMPPLPAFTWNVYVSTLGIEGYDGGLPSGTYRIGLACTFAARVTNLWETTIEVTQDATDEPVGISWKVTGSQPLDLMSSGSGADATWFVYALVAFGVVMALVAVVLRRSSRRSPERSPA